MRRKMRLLAVVAGWAGGILLLCVGMEASGQQDSSPKVFGGTFSELAPEQQRLLRDWAEQYSKLTGTRTDPAQLYDSARLSQRTTFDAKPFHLVEARCQDLQLQA